jgi:hypothetical protein
MISDFLECPIGAKRATDLQRMSIGILETQYTYLTHHKARSSTGGGFPTLCQFSCQRDKQCIISE